MVLTAAHCVPQDINTLKRLTVVAGSSLKRTGGSEHRVTWCLTHDNYHKTPQQTSVNDIALLKVDPPFEFNVKSGSKATVIGYGEVPAEEIGTSDNRQLRKVDLAIVDKNGCKSKLRDMVRGNLMSGQICAYKVGKDAFIGDSGGPLVVDGRLAGLVSWGLPCYSENPLPGVYTEVAYIIDWIKQGMSTLKDLSNS